MLPFTVTSSFWAESSVQAEIRAETVVISLFFIIRGYRFVKSVKDKVRNNSVKTYGKLKNLFHNKSVLYIEKGLGEWNSISFPVRG